MSLELELFMAHHAGFIEPASMLSARHHHPVSFRQVIHRQCSHCLFIFVFAFTSNPTLSSFSPPAGSVSAARFDVEPQFFRLSHWTLPHPAAAAAPLAV